GRVRRAPGDGSPGCTPRVCTGAIGGGAGQDEAMKIARRAAVPAFAVMEIVAAANARRAAGQSIINLCVGEPTTGASDAVRDLAQEILATGSLGYTEAMGSPRSEE